MLKRFICAILSILCVMSVFTACTSNETIVEESAFEVEGGTIVGDKITSTNSNVSTSVDKTQKKETVGKVEYSFDIETIPMPERELKSKTITVYNWGELGKEPNDTNILMQKEFGVKFKTILGTHASYWDTLAQNIASGKSPDLVVMPNWNFYPTPIANDLLEPLDDIIDIEGPLFEDTYAYNEDIKWKGKHYILLNDVTGDTWLYFNTKMFKNFGVDKTPKDYFLEDNWTWETLKECADKFVTLKNDGSIKTAGITHQNGNFHATSGVELCTTDGYTYNLNMKDQKVTEMMNFLYSMGKSGSKSYMMCNDAIASFQNGQVAMIITKQYALFGEQWKKIRNDIDWVPMPKKDASSSYYMEVALNPTPAIAKGAKNVEGAALYIEFNKWKNLGWQPSTYLKQELNSAQKKYKIPSLDSTKSLDNDEIEWTKEIFAKYDYKYATNFWASWAHAVDGSFDYPGMSSVLNGESWSAVIQKYEPVWNAAIKKYFEK